MNMVAFDLGGSGGKVILGKFDGEKIKLEPLHRFEHSPYLINGGLYWNIINIYQQLNIGLKKAIAATGDNITSFGIDSFSNDFAFISGGELITPLRSYRDNRTERYKEQIYNKLSPEELYSLTGNQNANFNTLMQLAAMKEAGQSYITDNADKMLFTPDLLIYFLTGEAVAEYTISSVSQIYSYSDNTWSKTILDAFKLSDKMFGRLVMPGTIVGKTTDSYNKQFGTTGFNVVSVCEHDTASAFLASTASGDTAIISSGTWALVGTELDAPVINDFGMKYNVANEGGYPGHHRLLRNVMGTWLLQEIRAYYNERGQELSYSQMESMADSETPFAYLIDVDEAQFFEPGNMPEKIKDACQRLYGSAPQSVGALVRCVYESLAFKYRWTIEILEHMTGKKLSTINIVGGGSKDKLMCAFTASACGRPVIAGPAEATAYGNMLVQLIAAGEINDIAEGKLILQASFETQQYEPKDTAIWDEKYQQFKSLFKLRLN
jgi:sugar (pentulose or hexulose) kinase